jgi:hypothetical protein
MDEKDISAFTGLDEGSDTASVPESNSDNNTEAAELFGGGDETSKNQSGQPAAWTAQLPKNIRDNADLFKQISGFKTVGELAEAYLDKGGGADFSDAKKVLEKLGFPKDGEKYEWEDSLKDGMAGFAEAARKAMLTKDQAKAVMEGMVEMDEARDRAVLAKVKEAAPGILRDLKQEFGDDALLWYKNAVKNTALSKELARTGLSVNPTIARSLVLLGREMSEDYTPSGSRGGRTALKSFYEGANFDYK